MKISEKFESIRVCDDDKARRVLNVSTARADISADEIESGVTIERLGEIGVPVFRYSTQVTIHGTIPDFNPEARPLGYKAIFRNQNGSLGVKYVAIDGAKKKLICAAARLHDDKARHFSACINSTGLELVFQAFDKESAISAFKSFPKDLIIGGLYAARGIFGEFYVVADIGAIEQRNLWPFIGALYGFNSQAELDLAQRAQDDADKARNEAWRAQNAIESAAREEKLKADRAALVARLETSHKRALPGFTARDGAQFILIRKGYDDVKARVYSIVKRAGALCFMAKDYSPETAAGFTPGKFDKTARLSQSTIDDLPAAVARGEIFLPIGAGGIQESARGEIAAPIIPALPVAGGIQVTYNAGKNGVELRFPGKPAQSVLDTLKRAGWRWSRFNSCWYSVRNSLSVSLAAKIAGLTDQQAREIFAGEINGTGNLPADRFDMQVEDNMAAACGL